MPPRSPVSSTLVSQSPLPLSRSDSTFSNHNLPASFPLSHFNQQGRRRYYPFSTLSRPPPSYPDHIPLTTSERLFLAAGSTLGSFLNPSRGDLIALCSETTTPTFLLRRLRDHMLASPSGRRILHDRPRITSTTLPSISTLQEMPAGSLGRTYATWLTREHVSPDTRDPVRHVDDPELAYVLQRYRESHDFMHVLAGALPTVREGEIAVKAFEFAALGLPMTGLACGSAVTLRHREEWRRFWTVLGPWAVRSGLKVGPEVLCVRWEEELEGDLEELRARLGVEPLPVLGEGDKDLRDVRRREREERKARRRAAREKEGEREVRLSG